MNFQFLIPNSSSDLMHSQGDCYFVNKILSVPEVTEKLRECKAASLNCGLFYIFDYFDTYFSIVENAANLNIKVLFRSFALLHHNMDDLATLLMDFIKDLEFKRADEKISCINLTKMVLYLLIQLSKAIDNVYFKTQVHHSLSKKQTKSVCDISDFKIWEQNRKSFLLQIFRFMELPLDKLWNPQPVEEKFINMLCDVAYRTLENPIARERGVDETSFHILGTAIKRYNHAFVFPVRIIQITSTSEAAAISVAYGIRFLYEEYNIASIFSVIIKDIVEALSHESSDNKVVRNISLFLIECATLIPKLVIPHLSGFNEELLNMDSYVIRNSVLQSMGEVIISHLTSENLTEELKETRDDFLHDLLSHMSDVSAYVRSKSLQIWRRLKEEDAVPLAWQHRVVEEAAERLSDRTPTVRKNAIILLQAFLERNPFAAKLSLKELHSQLEKEREKLNKIHANIVGEVNKAKEIEDNWLKLASKILPAIQHVLTNSSEQHKDITEEDCENLVPRISRFIEDEKYEEAVFLVRKADFTAGNAELRDSLTFNEQCTYFLTLLKSYLLLNNNYNNKNEDITTQANMVKFLEDSIAFSSTITKAVPKLEEMLMSKVNSDVFEAVEFFTTGYLFGIKGTERGMLRMLYLVWSGDKEKKDAVMEAYKRTFLVSDQTGRSHAQKVVSNICKFLEHLTQGHYAAMEVVIKEWVNNGLIDTTMIQVLFERFTLKQERTTENESRLALQFLIMVSAAKASICTANSSIIKFIAFEQRGLTDSRIFIGCMNLLLNSIPHSVRSKYYGRYEKEDPIIAKVTECFEQFFFFPILEDFDTVAMRTIDFFYRLCQSPDVICQKLLSGILSKLRLFAAQKRSSFHTDKVDNYAKSENEEKLPSILVYRLIFLVGYISMREMIFLDIDIYNNIKYREELKGNAITLNSPKVKSKLDMSASESLKRLQESAAQRQHETDEELVGATIEDNIAEVINHICENEILYSKISVFPKLILVVLEACKFPVKFNDNNLQQAACLCLLRFMSLSSKFCEANMPFLMNILTLSVNIKIKCNIIIGLSDLTFRFPNIIEPWTGHFYSMLHEKDVELRLTAVKILCHLILHEMIRVKGQIADLAICISDQNQEIKNISRQFFKEIAQKSNMLYNVLPDIISKLSRPNLDLEEEKYHVIMKYVLGLINKDKQIESLIEKLCFRFRVTKEERQWRDTAFCLSLLTYNERAIKKLIDNVYCFKDKLQVGTVYHSFKLIISNTLRLAKPELKALVLELDVRLLECLRVKQNGIPVSDKKPAKATGKKRYDRTEKDFSSSDEVSADEDFRFQLRANCRENGMEKSSRRIVQKTSKIMRCESSDDDSPQMKRGCNRKMKKNV